MARTQYETTSKYGMPIFDGSSTEDPSSIVPEGYSLDKAYQDQKPEDYLHTRTTRGAGRDGVKYTNSKVGYYKIEKPSESAPVAPAPAPEPEAEAKPKPATPIEHSPEVKQAIERVGAYKMDGNAGSQFSTDEPQAAEAKPDAQSFADKYKLNLLNKDAGQMDFSGV